MERMIGSSLSVISSNGIRYEGMLTAVDDKGAITLSNVKNFGTENRSTANGMSVKPIDKIFESVMFEKKDIKEVLPAQSNPAASMMPGMGGMQMDPMVQMQMQLLMGGQGMPPMMDMQNPMMASMLPTADPTAQGVDMQQLQ
eukprot:Sspe_Gene.96218::Locus_68774_Transcript_1_1_Confidence_1.000_Length_499::g.96218::m.96218